MGKMVVNEIEYTGAGPDGSLYVKNGCIPSGVGSPMTSLDISAGLVFINGEELELVDGQTISITGFSTSNLYLFYVKKLRDSFAEVGYVSYSPSDDGPRVTPPNTVPLCSLSYYLGGWHINDDALRTMPYPGAISTTHLLDEIPYSTFTDSYNNSYKFDVKSYMCNNNDDRKRVFDHLIVVCDFISTNSDVNLRMGTPAGQAGVSDAVNRRMLTINSDGVSSQFGDNSNIIISSSNAMSVSFMLRPMTPVAGIVVDSTDMNNISVSHLFGTQASANSSRYNLGSWIRLNKVNSNGKIPMWFDTRPDTGSMKVYGVTMPNRKYNF